MRSEETLDELRDYDLRVIQPKTGYRFSLDPLLLCDFAGVRTGERVVDLGTGSGVIPLVLARKSEGTTAVGVEFQQELAEMASRNVALNGLADRIEIMATDILSLRKSFPVSSFDLVVANPPYRKQGTGKISPRAGRDKARHESTATLTDFIAMAKYLVKPEGRICFIHHVSRLPDLFVESRSLKLVSARLRMVHGSTTVGAQMLLIEFHKGRRTDLAVLQPLFVHGADGEYSYEMKRIFGEGLIGAEG